MRGWVPNPSRLRYKEEVCTCWQGILKKKKKESDPAEVHLIMFPHKLHLCWRAYQPDYMSNTHMQSVSLACCLEYIRIDITSTRGQPAPTQADSTPKRLGHTQTGVSSPTFRLRLDGFLHFGPHCSRIGHLQGQGQTIWRGEYSCNTNPCLHIIVRKCLGGLFLS